MTTAPSITRQQRDRLFFDCYIDCGCNATEAARQQGVSPATIRRARLRHQRTPEFQAGLAAELAAFNARRRA
jgi:phage terminase small subunit